MVWERSARLFGIFLFFIIIQLFVVFDFDIFRTHVCMYVGKLLGNLIARLGNIHFYALSLCRSAARPLHVISRIIELFRQSYHSPVFDIYFYLQEEYSLILQRA